MTDSTPAASTAKVALITGGVRRVGAAIARELHRAGMKIALHYRSSSADAEALQQELEASGPGSVLLLPADLLDIHALPALVDNILQAWGQLDVLVNNASSFYPTPFGQVSEKDWETLLGSNLKAPFFLCQAAAPALQAAHGCIVNLVDIHGERPLKDHPAYSIAKAGLIMLTKSLARELGPHVRVNGIAPGAILWPEQGMDEVARHRVIAATALKRPGQPSDLARAARFLIESDYITGHILTVDGGRTLGNP